MGRGQTLTLLLAREAPGAQCAMVGAGSPPHLTQGRALSSAGRAEGSGMEHELPRGSPNPSCPEHSPIPGQQAARGRIRAGSTSQPRSCWVFLSCSNLPVSLLFPLRALSSPGSSVREV